MMLNLLPLPGVAVLFARTDSIYKSIPVCDVWDKDRDATRWPGGVPVIAHPPCRLWGRLRKQANGSDDEKRLAIWAVQMVRRWGGVLEHPAASLLWKSDGMPGPGERDIHGGWLMPIHQQQWGHRAEKKTVLYIVGCVPGDLPPVPYVMGDASHVIGGSRKLKNGERLRRGDPGWRPEVTKAEREATPEALATWLVQVALICGGGFEHGT